MLPEALEAQITQDAATALAEDLGNGDITAQLVAAELQGKAQVICREAATLCGRAWFNRVFSLLDEAVTIHWYAQDGDTVAANQKLCTLGGAARSLLSGERTALNFLQTLSGTATIAQHYAQQLEGLATRILDTRKTIPGLRHAQKYAVRCGGCHNHRMGLYDAFLIKENHIAAAGSIAAAVNNARSLNSTLPVEVETETLEEVEQSLAAGANRIMLDNFTLDEIRVAVTLTAGRSELEASGGICINNLREIAETGIDFISIGALTKDVKAVDLSMRFK